MEIYEFMAIIKKNEIAWNVYPELQSWDRVKQKVLDSTQLQKSEKREYATRIEKSMQDIYLFHRERHEGVTIVIKGFAVAINKETAREKLVQFCNKHVMFI
jgi:hypothetical protein